MLFANEHDADPGLVGEHLAARGVGFTRCRREDPGGWPDPAAADLMVLLGSDWSVYWPDVATSVTAEAAAVRAAHFAGVPLLGICFGAQLVAHALGGDVSRAPVAEVGWYEVEPCGPAIERGPWLQWHVDRFSVPPGFELLATSPAGAQAVVGGRTLAVQFHPEVTPAIIDRWSSGAGEVELAGHGVRREDLLADTVARSAEASERCSRLVHWFCEEVAGR